MMLVSRIRAVSQVRSDGDGGPFLLFECRDCLTTGLARRLPAGTRCSCADRQARANVARGGQAYKVSWNSRYADSERTAVLEEGMEVVPIGITAE
jgi:hypothetical protein